MEDKGDADWMDKLERNVVISMANEVIDEEGYVHCCETSRKRALDGEQAESKKEVKFACLQSDGEPITTQGGSRPSSDSNDDNDSSKATKEPATSRRMIRHIHITDEDRAHIDKAVAEINAEFDRRGLNSNEASDDDDDDEDDSDDDSESSSSQSKSSSSSVEDAGKTAEVAVVCETGLPVLHGKPVFTKRMDEALLIIGMQNDYMEGGSVAVSHANDLVPLIKDLIQSGYFGQIIFTKEFHPPEYYLFASAHGKKPQETLDDGTVLLPDHCTWRTTGSHICNGLFVERLERKLIYKGMQSNTKSVNSFYESDPESITSTELPEHLKTCGIKRIAIVGVPIEQCIQATALEAVSQGYATHVFTDACKGYSQEACDKAYATMIDNNVSCCLSTDYLNHDKILKELETKKE